MITIAVASPIGTFSPVEFVNSHRLSSCLCGSYGCCKKVGKNKVQTVEKTDPVTQRTRHLLDA